MSCSENMKGKEQRGSVVDQQDVRLGRDHERCQYHAKDLRFGSLIDGKPSTIFKQEFKTSVFVNF